MLIDKPLLPLTRPREKLKAVVVRATLPTLVVLTRSVPSMIKLIKEIEVSLVAMKNWVRLLALSPNT